MFRFIYLVLLKRVTAVALSIGFTYKWGEAAYKGAKVLQKKNIYLNQWRCSSASTIHIKNYK